MVRGLIWRRHHYRWRAANFDLCAIEQWGFSRVPHLLYTWHPFIMVRGPVTLSPIAERVAVKLSLPGFRLRSVAVGIRTPNLPLGGQRSNPLRRYMILYFVCKEIRWVFQHHMSHAIYTAASVWSIYRYNVISFFDTPLNLLYIFARF